MAGNVRIKLKKGTSEIEVEGLREDVDALLEQWWKHPTSPEIHGEEEGDDEGTGGTPIKTTVKKSRRPPRRTSDREDSAASGSPDFDPVALANSLKEREDFHEIESKVLHQDDLWNRVMLILWASDSGLTSGDIFRTLHHHLDTKTTLSSVSKCLKRNASKVTHSDARKAGGTIVKYKLTGRARSDFEKWLLKGTAPAPADGAPSDY
ncbi:MAG TPA: hypothetical protein VF624_01025 [Tepidisphaeraceae bacterium]|jgi:hypothetical protein